MNPNLNIKLISWFSIIFLLVSLYFNWSLNRKNKELRNFKDDTLEKLKADKDSIIQARELRIDSLLIDNKIKDGIIADAQTAYDSLQTVKDSIRVVFKYKYNEMDGFTSKDIENYWKDEFK